MRRMKSMMLVNEKSHVPRSITAADVLNSDRVVASTEFNKELK